jgi:integrase
LEDQPLEGSSSVEPEREVPRFDKFIDEWMKTYVETNNKPSEIFGKKCIVNGYLKPAFGSLKLDSPDWARKIEQFKAARVRDGRSAKRINNYLTCLRRALVSARQWGHIDRIPEIQWMKAPPSSFDFLTREESDRLLAAMPTGFRAMALTALRSGLRLGELLALRWEDIDLHTGKILVRRSVWKGTMGAPKSNRHREIPMSPELLVVLKAHRHLRGALVFCSEDGSALTRDMIKKVLPAACTKAGLRTVQWHALRHSFASQLVTEGVPLKAIQELLGHATITMTMRYAHLAPSLHIEAVARLDRAAFGHHLGTGAGSNS